jgi:hypothetical protein
MIAFMNGSLIPAKLFYDRYPSYWSYSALDFSKIASTYYTQSETIESDSEISGGLGKVMAKTVGVVPAPSQY